MPKRWLVLTGDDVTLPALPTAAPVSLRAVTEPPGPVGRPPLAVVLALPWAAVRRADHLAEALAQAVAHATDPKGRPLCPLALLIVLDETAPLPLCGRWDADPAAAMAAAADAVARAALDDDACGTDTLLCPDLLLEVAQAVPLAPLAGVFVAAAGSDLAPLFTPRQPPARPRRWPLVAAVSVVAASVAAAAAAHGWMTEREQTLARLGAELALPPGAAAAPVAVRALNDLAVLAEDGAFSSPLAPLSQTDDLDREVASLVAARLPEVLTGPVWSRLAAEDARVAEAIAAYAKSPPRRLPEETERVLALLADAAEVDLRRRQASLTAEGSPRTQWEAVTAWTTGRAVALPFLDTAAGRAALAAAIAEAPDPAVSPAAPLITAALPRLRQAAEAAEAGDDIAAARDTAAAALDDLYHGPADPDRLAAALGELRQALDDLATAAATLPARRDAVAQRLRSEAGPLVAALETAGTVPAGAGRTVEETAAALTSRAATRLAAVALPGLGPVFTDSGALAPDVAATRAALTALREGGFAEPAGVKPADFTTLARLDGAPDVAWLTKAEQRLAAYETWREAALPQVPQALRPLLADHAALEAGIGAVVEVATAFQASGLGAEQRPATADVAAGYAAAAPPLRGILTALSGLSGSLSQDVGWLVSVRAYRALERLDREYAARPVAALAPRLAGADAAKPFLLGDALPAGSATDAAGLAEAEWRALQDTTDAAAPLLDLLNLRAVDAAIGQPVLRERWAARAAVVQAGDRAPVEHFAAFLASTIDGFSAARCGGAGMAPAPALFSQERQALEAAMAERCRAVPPAVLPTRKPVPETASEPQRPLKPGPFQWSPH